MSDTTKSGPSTKPPGASSGNVLLFPRREPDFTDAERLEIRQMMGKFNQIAAGCPSARRLTREE